MTQPQISAKLSRALSRRPRGEKDVVYILVEIRKLLDHTGNKARYFWLRFFCDWACHIKMDRKAANELMERLDAELDVIKGGTPKVGVKRPPTLHTFRKEFEAFLKENGIHAGIDYNRLDWPVFLRYYAEVVANCPIVYQVRGNKLMHIDEVVLVSYGKPSDPKALPSGYKFKFGMKWSLRKNGVEVKAYPLEFVYEKPKLSN
jgi:hypothetical protein